MFFYLKIYIFLEFYNDVFIKTFSTCIVCIHFFILKQEWCFMNQAVCVLDAYFLYVCLERLCYSKSSLA